jgi:ABC-2 type transport system permease protein
MTALADMIWIELRKALRSRVPLFTGLMSLFMPLGVAFLIFVARNPDISRRLGLISAKANLLAYSATDWPAYMRLSAMIAAAGAFFLFVLAVSWTFGREFADGTLKDMLAVPVSRATIVLAKFVLVAAWCAALSVVMLLLGLVMGAVIGLPGGTAPVIVQGSGLVLATACLVIATITPFAFFASAGRGYLLPVGLAVLSLMAANVVGLAGWGEYFPWAVPGLLAQGDASLSAASYWIVVLTGLAGMLATYLWWMHADQSR